MKLRPFACYAADTVCVAALTFASWACMVGPNKISVIPTVTLYLLLSSLAKYHRLSLFIFQSSHSLFFLFNEQVLGNLSFAILIVLICSSEAHSESCPPPLKLILSWNFVSPRFDNDLTTFLLHNMHS